MDEEKKPLPEAEGSEEESQISMLRKQLYAKEESTQLQQRQRELATPKAPKKQDASQQNAKPNLVNVVAERSRKRRKVLRVVGLVLLLAVVLAGSIVATLWYRRTKQVTSDQIHLTIAIPEDVIAGQTSTYDVEYRNDSKVRWDNVEVLVDVPAGMRVKTVEPTLDQTAKQQYTLKVGSLEAGQSGTIKVAGQLIGEQGASLIARSKISFTPENFPSGSFDKSESVTTTISSVPIEISVEASNAAADGERTPVVIHVRNNGSETITGGRLKLEIAPGILLAVEDEAFSSEFSSVTGSWQLPPLEPLQEITRTVILFLDGQPSERRILTIRGLVSEDGDEFALRTVDQVFTISASELSLSQSFNDSGDQLVARAGETFKAKVMYKNTGTLALSNAVVTVQFEGSSIDPATIKLDSGSYDPTTKTITWRSSSVPGLAVIQPQQAGEITYEFSLLPTENFPTDDTAKNQNLIVTSTIDSPNLPVSGDERRVITDRRVFPVATDVTLDVDSFYDDGRLGIESTGPTPPKVGETTTYTVRLRLGTTLNDVGDVEVKAVLPDGVNYTGNNFKTVGEIDFNERTNEIVWSIPFVEGLAGRAKPGPELHMQVAITPGENIRDEEVVLLQSAVATASDLFSEETVGNTFPESDLPTTDDAVPGKGKVE